MRPLVIDPRQLRGAVRDLEAASDEVATSVARVDAPCQGYPWHGLVDEGVVVLLRDAEAVVAACRRISDALEDCLVDFADLDAHVADAAGRR